MHLRLFLVALTLPLWAQSNLTVGNAISGRVLPGAPVSWKIHLARGQVFNVAAASRTASLTLNLEDEHHKGLAKAFSLGGTGGKSILKYLAEQDCDCTLTLTDDTKQATEAEFELAVHEELGGTDEAAIKCGDTIARGQALLVKKQYQDALPLFEDAEKQAQTIGDMRLQAFALNRLALAWLYQEDYAKSAGYYERALTLQREAGQPWETALTLNNLAIAQSQLGNCRTAAKLLEEARGIREQFTDQVSVAYTWIAVANAQYCVGDLQATLDAYLESLTLWRELKGNPNQTQNLTQVENNLGVAYLSVGEWDDAKHWLDEALTMRRQDKNRRGEGETLYNLGLLAAAKGETHEALRLYEQALPVLRESGYRQGEGYALSGMSELHGKLGETARALEESQQAQALLHLIGNKYGEGYAWQDLGQVRAATADVTGAREAFGKALELQRDVGDKTGETITLFSLGQLEERSGNSKAAQEAVQSAAALVEESRARMLDPGHRAAYLASERAVFEFQAAIAMQNGDPVSGLHASEAAHARSLLDEVAGGAGIDRKFIEEEQDLEEQLRKTSSPQLASRRAELEEQIRRAHPAQAAFAYARPADLDQIRSVLDSNTALIEYLTGDDRSYVWTITKTAVHARKLPSRSILDAEVKKLDNALVARNVHPFNETLTERLKRLAVQDAVVSQTAAQISRQLFDSTVSHEGVRRFLIVPDGPLHLLPFALLPALHGYSIACLPSASVLVERLRGDTQAKTYRPVLVLAGSTPYAMQEATNIRQLVNSKDLEMKSGRAASRSIFNQPELVHFGLIHIASHAVVDLEHPENTGVELADGRLTAQRILSVSLNARLATLSACETASGKPVAGEGLMGLTRSFLYAGAHMVLAALWQVDDQATAQFMGYFYRSLLQEGQPAAVAVRAAQDRMRSQPRWSNPYYWAAFTLQGDWK